MNDALAGLVLPQHDWRAALEAAAGEGDEHPTWAYAWPAGDRLATELTALEPTLDCRRVCDLGCGRGRLGLVALRHGASVVFADGSPHPLTWLRAVLAANRLQAELCVHRWGDPLPAPVDLILGGDILYRPECFDALLATIATSLAPGGRALLSDPRHRLEPELPTLAAAHGLRWTTTRRDAGYTLARLALV